MTLAPITLFVYNRPQHTLRVLQKLKANRLADQSTLYIFSDGLPASGSASDLENIEKVREIARSEQWCGKVNLVFRESNLGLAASIVQGVTRIVNEYGKIIVLEDDLLPSPGFLEYTNQALDYYQHIDRVMHISAYMYPHLRIPFSGIRQQTALIQFMACWGWGTWKRAWDNYNPSADDLLAKLHDTRTMERFNLDGTTKFMSTQLEWNVSGKLNSWAIKWYASIVLRDGLCLYPKTSLVQNIGNDGTGTHPDKAHIYSYQKIAPSAEINPIPLHEHPVARKQIRDFFIFLEKKKTILDKAIEKLYLIR